MKTQPDLSVAMHVGAHKTATTHFQRSLMEVKGRLAGQGVEVWLPAHLRRARQSLAERFQLSHFRNLPPATQTTQQALAELRRNADRVVFSEENFIGTPGNRWGNLSRPLYGSAGPRLQALAEAIAPGGIEVFLSIRQPTRFLNSMFTQVLMGGQAVPLEKFIEKNPVVDVDWVDLVGRIAEPAGVRSVTVWRYEDYRGLFDRICHAMLGDAAQQVVPVSSHVHRGLSQAAVDRILSEGKGAAIDAARDAFPSGENFPAFDAFDAEVHGLADQLYAAQCGVIAQMPKVTFLRM